MLIRVITTITLILFMLLLLSGAPIDTALYRSLLVFMSLFALIYITIFLLNVLKNDAEEHITVPNSRNTGTKNTKGDE